MASSAGFRLDGASACGSSANGSVVNGVGIDSGAPTSNGLELDGVAHAMSLDPNIPAYAVAVVEALARTNQEVIRRLGVIEMELRGLRESREREETLASEARAEEKRERLEAAAEESAERSKENLAFSVYVRHQNPASNNDEMNGGGGQKETEGEKRGAMEIKTEYNDEEGEDGEEESDDEGTADGDHDSSVDWPVEKHDAAMREFNRALSGSSMGPSSSSLKAQHGGGDHSGHGGGRRLTELERLLSMGTEGSGGGVASSPGVASGVAGANQSMVPISGFAPKGSKRLVMPCPRSGCEVILFSELGFSAHLRVHDGLLPFACSECGREFRLRDGLNKHMRTHTGERPYSCWVCGKNFKRVHHRKKHFVAKHRAAADSYSQSLEQASVHHDQDHDRRNLAAEASGEAAVDGHQLTRSN